MGQFDSETDAALAQLSYGALAETPGGEFAEIIGDLLMLVGTGGLWAVAGGASNLLQKVRKLAGASYGDNLIYAITAVGNDLASLRKYHEELRERIDSLDEDPRFAEAIAAVALRAMHTSVKDRLKRLARLVVSGVKDEDLEIESLDDMMRAAVELDESDIRFLARIYDAQSTSLDNKQLTDDQRSERLIMQWPNQLPAPVGRPTEISAHRCSVARLQAHAMVQYRTPGAGAGGELVFLLEDGAKFYERLQEIGTVK